MDAQETHMINHWHTHFTSRCQAHKTAKQDGTHRTHDRCSQHDRVIVPTPQHHAVKRKERDHSVGKRFDVVAKQQVTRNAKSDKQNAKHKEEGNDIRCSPAQGFRNSGEPLRDENIIEDFRGDETTTTSSADALLVNID